MIEDRKRIDPEERYPAEGLRRVEALALRVLALMPKATVTRTRDVIQLDTEGEEGIVVLITAEAVEMRLPTIEWTMNPYGPARSSVLWRRVKTKDLDDDALASLLVKAHQTRQRQWVTCRYCHQRVPPEHRHGKVCHSCAERYEGIVH